MLRGEIYWADLNPVVGSEIAKIRPVLIVSNDINNEYGSTITVLPITSSTAKVYPFEVRLLSSEGGLKSESKIKANQVRTIDKLRIRSRLGAIAKSRMEEVNRALLIHLALV
ncbi:type II toxin-antitoxin system PemK/MazF family toxin [Dyadobacter sp. Leaf189]|uniref:type II toxin-antitoxin system PemK/MazF family toxin n=1 Tax=Dyadobacter sp. Leaf189 TaxID=1736295 RepID=UPI0006FB4924|nr:MazF family transcriptional regulator [Dyadobacter sp. Leaf189]